MSCDKHEYTPTIIKNRLSFSGSFMSPFTDENKSPECKFAIKLEETQSSFFQNVEICTPKVLKGIFFKDNGFRNEFAPIIPTESNLSMNAVEANSLTPVPKKSRFASVTPLHRRIQIANRSRAVARTPVLSKNGASGVVVYNRSGHVEHRSTAIRTLIRTARQLRGTNNDINKPNDNIESNSSIDFKFKPSLISRTPLHRLAASAARAVEEPCPIACVPISPSNNIETNTPTSQFKNARVEASQLDADTKIKNDQCRAPIRRTTLRTRDAASKRICSSMNGANGHVPPIMQPVSNPITKNGEIYTNTTRSKVRRLTAKFGQDSIGLACKLEIENGSSCVLEPGKGAEIDSKRRLILAKKTDVNFNGAEVRVCKEVTSFTLVIGREKNFCDLAVEDLKRPNSVSRRHATVSAWKSNSGWHALIIDNSSTTGTYINGKRILTGQLRDGDLVSFGALIDEISLDVGEENDTNGNNVAAKLPKVGDCIADLSRLPCSIRVRLPCSGSAK